MKPTVERIFPSGALEISALAGNSVFRRVYYGYTKRDALRAFRLEYKHTHREKRGGKTR